MNESYEVREFSFKESMHVFKLIYDITSNDIYWDINDIIFSQDFDIDLAVDWTLQESIRRIVPDDIDDS